MQNQHYAINIVFMQFQHYAIHIYIASNCFLFCFFYIKMDIEQNADGQM